MNILLTFRQPEKISADQWRFMLNAWMAISLVGALVGSLMAIITAFLLWSMVPRAIQDRGWLTGLGFATVPAASLAFATPWWWFFLSSRQTSRRFPPTGGR
jgi:hypothetical protein